MNKLLFCFLLFAVAHASAQQMNGKVLDATTNKPLPYATVLYDFERKILYTDSSGNFSLNKDTLNEKDSIYIVYLGYKRLGISVVRLSTQNIFRMAEESQNLEPVVVTNCRQYKDYTINRKVGKIKEYIGPGPETKFIILGRYLSSRETNGYIKQLEIYAGNFNASIHVPVRLHWYDWDTIHNMPGKELTSSNIIVYPYQKGWNSFILPVNSIYFSEEGIVIGLEFIYPVEYMQQYSSLTSFDQKTRWLMDMNNRWSVGIETTKDANQTGFYQVNNFAIIRYNSRGRDLYIKPAIRFSVTKCVE